PQYQPPRPEKKRRMGRYIAILVFLLLIISVSFAAIFQTFGGDLYPAGDKVAVIYVQGTMLTGSIPGGLGYVTSEEISDNIRRASKDENVRAIVLRINSGGGSPTASEEIVREMKRAQEDGLPIVVSMGDVAASAAYYISAPADVILANPSTMTGSIGVIWTFQNMSKYYDEEGIEFHIAKSGEFKDMGGTWRGLTDEEKEYADTVIIEIYDNFVDEVASGRNMSRSDVKDIADGRIYTGASAKKIGLVDDFGNLYDAIDLAAELGGIEGEPTVVYMNRPSLSSLLFGAEAESLGQSLTRFVNYFEENPFGKIVA
ncbi:MAG: signal peptide peptidase SppA, partial [Methanosarcinaceae archaeon]|nr:signal peptide peptidase SppA [Methanosarcinaceae archaeon]